MKTDTEVLFVLFHPQAAIINNDGYPAESYEVTTNDGKSKFQILLNR